MSGASRSFAALAAAIVLWICSAGSALALDLVVDTTTDSIVDNPLPGVSFRRCDPLVANDCSLRGAIVRANAVPGPHTITLPAGFYALTLQGANEDAAATGDLDVLQDITINGVNPLATVISWDAGVLLANRDRIFHVLPSGSLTVRDLSIRLGGAGGGLGGGVFSQGALVMERVSSRLHQTGSGGAVYVSGGTAVIRASTINDNTALAGGGILVVTGGIANVSVENSTISNNHANSGPGGGLYVESSSPNVVVTLSNVTLANNSASASGGGIFRNNAAVVILRNTIIANNAAAVGPNCSSSMSSEKFNLVYGAVAGDTCGLTSANHDLVNSTFDPRLGPLQDNGGPTATHALQAGSAALDAGNDATPGSGGDACPATDQRGLTRTIDGDGDGTTRCDIGAAEGGLWLAVNTVTDSNDTSFRACNLSATPYQCSLRGAISLANSMPAGFASVITLPANGNPYRLTLTGASENANASGDLDVNTDLTIVGGGANTTIVDGNGTDRVFHVLSGTLRALRLQDLTIQNGNAGSSSPGGGVWVESPASLLRTRVRANAAQDGGGISTTNGTTKIFDSTINGNTATGFGGGIVNGVYLLTVVNTTISGNQAPAFGGGGLAQIASATGNPSAIILSNVTIAGNSAANGGGVLLTFGSVTSRNTLVTGNTASTNPNCSGTNMASQGYNLLFGAGSCGFTAGTDRQGQTAALDPKLGPLQLNSGTTETRALLPGSAAIDAGNPLTPDGTGAACGARDQRAVPRPTDGDGVSGPRCDIGAYEAAACTSLRPRVAVQTQKIGPGQIQAIITAGSAPLGLLRLGQPRPLQNAVVNVQGGPQNITTAQDVTVSGTQVVITVTRQGGPGTAVTVPFQVVDGCSSALPWSTFVGFGSGV